MNKDIETRVMEVFDKLVKICPRCFETNTTMYIAFINTVLYERGQQQLNMDQIKAIKDYKPSTVMRVRLDYMESNAEQLKQQEVFAEYYRNKKYNIIKKDV